MKNTHVWATRASRFDVVLALLTATLLAFLLAALVAWATPGGSQDVERRITIASAATLAMACAVWAYSRAESRDFGVCVVAWEGEGIKNREELANALAKTSRTWVPIEAIPPTGQRAKWTGDLGRDLGAGIQSALHRSVGSPRVAVAASAPDAVGFLLGVHAGPFLRHAHVDVMRPPTKDVRSWSMEIQVTPESRADLFRIRTAEGSSTCSSGKHRMLGIAVINPDNCHPSVGPQGVADGLLAQRVVCCRGAILTMQPSNVGPSSEDVRHAARFVRERSRAILGDAENSDLFLVCGSDVAFSIGLILSGFGDIRPWVYSDRRWKPWN